MKTSIATAAFAALCFAAPLAAHAGDATGSPITREQVKEELRNWKAAGLMAPAGEASDTREVLDNRETFAALQTEVILAEYAAAERTMQTLAAAPMQPVMEEEVIVVVGQ